MNFSRRNLKYIICLSAVIAVAAVSMLAPRAAVAKRVKPKTQIKFATVAPEGSTWMKIMREFDDELRVATENRLGFKFYPGGVQGDEMETLRKIRNGQIHGGGFSGFGLGAIAPAFRAIELPFMFRNLDEVDHTRQAMDSYYRELFEQKGYVLLGWADVGFVYLYSNRPITSPAELNAPKIWTWSGDKLAELFFKAFEVSPIPLALPDVLTSLQMGVVDAVYAPPLACLALQWFTRVKYMTDIPITYGFGAMLVSVKTMKKISDTDVATLKRLAEKHSQSLIAKTRVQNVEAIESIRGAGVEILAPDAASVELFFKTGKGAWKDGIGKMYSAELLDRVTTTVDEYRATRKASNE